MAWAALAFTRVSCSCTGSNSGMTSRIFLVLGASTMFPCRAQVGTRVSE